MHSLHFRRACYSWRSGSFQSTANLLGEANWRWGLLLLDPTMWTAFSWKNRIWSLPVTCGHWYTPCWPTSINNDHLLHKSHGQTTTWQISALDVLVCHLCLPLDLHLPPSFWKCVKVKASQCSLHSLCLTIRPLATISAPPATRLFCCHSRKLHTTSLSPAALFLFLSS